MKSNLLRTILAAWGANRLSKKNGCGCIGTIVFFIILYAILGYVLDWF